MSVDTATRDGVISLDSNERCIHELIRRQCGYCRVPPPPTFAEALFDTPNDGEDGDEYEPVKSFTTKDSGHCAKCDQYYGQGERISITVTGERLCSECAP